MKPCCCMLLAFSAFAQSWTPQTSGVTASLRGLSAVSDRVVWASGTGGTFLRTTDGGATWRSGKVPGGESLDFRGLRAFDAETAYLLSIGPNGSSRIYKTTDGGTQWSLLFTHPDPKGFLDSIAFWDRNRGIVVGDALNGMPDVRLTTDGGLHWERSKTPAAIPNEGAFAASNSCIFLADGGKAWFVTGGTGAARVFSSPDGGKSWSVTPTPVRNDSASAGIFSIALASSDLAVVVGGDYSKDKEDTGNIAVTRDAGKTWTVPRTRPAGFRSAVAWVPELRTWVAVGTSGSDVSGADAESWKKFDDGSYNAVSFAPGGAGWAAGARGRIARFVPPSR